MSDIQVTGSEEIEIYKNDIDTYINLWKEERKIEDICKVSQNRWYNCCKYVYENVFKNNQERLKVPNNLYNAYDEVKVNNILDIYIDLCNDYEKVININGFTLFTGIHRDTINGWSNGQGLGSSSSDICKKLDIMREESLVGLQISGKGNPMCYMPALNRYCGFNMPGVNNGTVEKPKTVEQIAAERGLQLEDKPQESPAIEPPRAEF